MSSSPFWSSGLQDEKTIDLFPASMLVDRGPSSLCPHMVEGTRGFLDKVVILFARVPTLRMNYLLTALPPNINHITRTSTFGGQGGHRNNLYYVQGYSSVVACLSGSGCRQYSIHFMSSGIRITFLCTDKASNNIDYQTTPD